MVFGYIYLLITIVQLKTSICVVVVADDAFRGGFSAKGRTFFLV